MAGIWIGIGGAFAWSALIAGASQIHSITICSIGFTGVAAFLTMGQLLWPIMRLFLSAALAFLFVFSMPSTAMASDLVRGGQIFNTNCAACHAGGGNVVKGERTLSNLILRHICPRRVMRLQSWLCDTEEMRPAFLDVLSENEIADVAAYVEDQASHGWS